MTQVPLLRRHPKERLVCYNVRATKFPVDILVPVFARNARDAAKISGWPVTGSPLFAAEKWT